LLPFADAWAQRQELALLKTGMSLTPSQFKDAQQAGVLCPEKVRLMVSDVIPVPKDLFWAACTFLYQLVCSKPIGFALGYGIYIQPKYLNSRSVLVHELVHVAQHERFDDLKAFVKAYLSEVLEFGYRNAPLEQEAKAIEEAICVVKLSNRRKL